MAIVRIGFVLATLFIAFFANHCAFASVEKDAAKNFANRVAGALPHHTRKHAKASDRRRELLSVRGNARNLLQGPKHTTCVWDSIYGKCDLSDEALFDALSSSKNDFSQFVAEFAACERLPTKKLCKTGRGCVWDKEDDQCLFVKFQKGRRDSPCYEKAPATINLLVAFGQCPSIGREKKCNRHPSCTWGLTDDESDYACDGDVLNLLFGITTNEFLEVSEVASEEWAVDFWITHDFINADFDWDTVLNYEGPTQRCPEDASEEVCEFLERVLFPAIPEIFYCVLRYIDYDQIDACDEDPLCFYDYENGLCQTTTVANSASIAPLFQNAVPLIEKKADRKIFDVFFECLGHPTEAECKGKCAFYDDECYADAAWWFNQVAAPGDKGDDALCTYFSALAASDCQEPTPEAGYNADICEVRPLDAMLLPSYEYLADYAITRDASVRRLKNKCAKSGTSRSCLGTTA